MLNAGGGDGTEQVIMKISREDLRRIRHFNLTSHSSMLKYPAENGLHSVGVKPHLTLPA